MKSLLNFEFRLLKEYEEFKSANPGNWNICSYLNLFYSLDAALALSKLYFPDFIEERNCIILGFRYDKQAFEQWYEALNGEISLVEKYCNQYDLKDYFHINSGEDIADELFNEKLSQFGKILKLAWELNCTLLYPERNIVVEIFESYGVSRITLYSQAL